MGRAAARAALVLVLLGVSSRWSMATASAEGRTSTSIRGRSLAATKSTSSSVNKPGTTVAVPDAECKSGYARAGSFDPDRQGPFCLTEHEVSGTLPGTAPASTKKRAACPSGWAWSGVIAPEGGHELCLTAREVAEAASQKDLKGSPSKATHAIGQDGSKKKDEEGTVRLQGHVNVNIREYDAEGGMHTRAIKVPLDMWEKGHMDFSKPALKKLKINGLLLARDNIRKQFGLPSGGEPEQRERIEDNEKDYNEKTLSRDTSETKAYTNKQADSDAAKEDRDELETDKSN